MRISSSSSSSRESAARQGKKGNDKKNKDKKDKNKKDKKSKKGRKKDDKKEKKRIERAESWDCDRIEAKRLLKQLLELDADIADDLEGVFSAIDSGETVRIDGLENKTARKKLRHLLQAFKLMPDDKQGFRTANSKVSFVALFQRCLRETRGKMGLAVDATGNIGSAAPRDKAGAASVPGLAVSVAGNGIAASAGTTTRGAGEEVLLEGGQEDGKEEPAEIQEPAKPRKVGPQLPGASVGPVVGGDGDSDEGEKEPDEEQGPRLVGAERRGVDLDDLPEESAREAWMSMPHEALAGAFADGVRKAERFEIRRSPEEQAAFEKMVKERGPSLLKRKMEGAFEGHEQEQERARKRRPVAETSDLWGASKEEQERGLPGKGTAATMAPHRAFDPEKDLTVRKPMSGDDFAKLVENSSAGLAGRFGRGNFATSFL